MAAIQVSLGVSVVFPTGYLIPMEWLKAFNLDVELFSPECLVAMSWHAKFYIKVATPLAASAVLGAILWHARRLTNCRTRAH